MLEPIPVPALSDNYIWLLKKAYGTAVAIVDPGEAAPVLDAIKRDGYNPVAVIITHHHGDHVDGLADVRHHYPGIPVYGPADDDEDIRGITDEVSGGDQVEISELGVRFDVYDTPGHTLGHISLHGGGVLVCGDTLFAGGCGRVFEGTNEQMAESLAQLAALPAETRCCCGHEYTLKNLAFARAVEPDNEALAEREREAQSLREAGKPTVPFPLGPELETNPFLRCDQPAVHSAAEQRAGRKLGNTVEVFGVLRDWKNNF